MGERFPFKVRELKHPWDCCQECGRQLGMGEPAIGGPVSPEDVAEDPNGRRVTFVYTHKGDCPPKEHK